MRTTIDIDEKLLAEVMRIGGYKTKRAAVEAALRLFIEHHKRNARFDSTAA